MVTSLPNNAVGAVVMDASVLVAICAKEAGSELKALAETSRYTRMNYAFFAPGVIISEVLYVLCGKRDKGLLVTPNYAQAIVDLETFATGLFPPPYGEASLVRRAEVISSNYTCRRSADGIYIALAEQLTGIAPTVLLTFDQDMPKQAARNASTVTVQLLVP